MPSLDGEKTITVQVQVKAHSGDIYEEYLHDKDFWELTIPKFPGPNSVMKAERGVRQALNGKLRQISNVDYQAMVRDSRPQETAIDQIELKAEIIKAHNALVEKYGKELQVGTRAPIRNCKATDPPVDPKECISLLDMTFQLFAGEPDAGQKLKLNRIEVVPGYELIIGDEPWKSV